jgi:hypothetical protein
MYSVCAVAWTVWHEAALDFLDTLFHGQDFRKIQPVIYNFFQRRYRRVQLPKREIRLSEPK